MEDEEAMEYLIQEDKETIDSYIEINRTIAYMNDLLRSKNLGSNLCDNLPDHIESNIHKHTTYKVSQLKTKEDVICLLDSLKNVRDLINIKEIEKKRLERLLTMAKIKGTQKQSALEIYEEAWVIQEMGTKLSTKGILMSCMLTTTTQNGSWHGTPTWIFSCVSIIMQLSRTSVITTLKWIQK